MGTVTRPNEIVAVESERATMMASIIAWPRKFMKTKELHAGVGTTTHWARNIRRLNILLGPDTRGVCSPRECALASLRCQRLHGRADRAARSRLGRAARAGRPQRGRGGGARGRAGTRASRVRARRPRRDRA